MVNEKIKKIRKKKGLNQFDLAELIGVSQPAISKLENSTDLSVRNLFVIATALDVPVTDFFTIEDDEPVMA